MYHPYVSSRNSRNPALFRARLCNGNNPSIARRILATHKEDYIFRLVLKFIYFPQKFFTGERQRIVDFAALNDDTLMYIINHAADNNELDAMVGNRNRDGLINALGSGAGNIYATILGLP